MTTCDWCNALLSVSDLFNVDYTDGFANVLCADCVDEAHKLFEDTLEGVWQ
jgi:hypothetical protein